MKILFVFNHPAPYKIKLFNELARYMDLEVAFERKRASNRNKLFYKNAAYNFNHVYLRGIPIGKENHFSLDLIHLIKNNNYDLIIMNGYSTLTEMMTIKYLNNHKMPYALYINGGIIPKQEPKWKKRLKRKYISSAKYFFSPTKESTDYLLYYGANKKNIYEYSYSTLNKIELLDEPLSREQKEKIRQELNISSFKHIATTIGELCQRKNQLYLLKIWNTMPKDFLLIIIGEGKDKKKIEHYIKENKLNNVLLTGFLDRKNTFKYIKASDLTIFPTRQDIYGHVVLESLSQWVPIISSPNANSALKYIVKNRTGLFLPLDDSAAAKDIIIKGLDILIDKNDFSVVKEATIEKNALRHFEQIEEMLRK